MTVRLAEPPGPPTVPSTVAPSVNRTVPPTPEVTAACSVTERAAVAEAVRLVVVGVAAMSTTDSADCEATNAEESAGTNSAVNRCVPRSRSVAWNDAVPPDERDGADDGRRRRGAGRCPAGCRTLR